MNPKVTGMQWVALLALILLGLAVLPLVAQEPKKADAKGDQEKLQGTWSVEKFLRNGMPYPDERRKQMVFVVEGNKMAFKVGDREQTVKFTLDPSQNPKTIDMVDPDRAEMKAIGIYLLEGDKLTILRVEASNPRPKSFDDSTKEGTILWEFKRKAK